MKKGILVAILALLTSVTLVGCGQKSGDQTNADSENVASSTEKSEDTQEQSTEGNTAENTEEAKDGDASNEEDKDKESDELEGEPMDLGEQKVQGETLEGSIYHGKYRLINGSDRVVVEWSENAFKNVTEYVFEGDKLSAIRFARTYENEEQAKADYESAGKQSEAANKLKDLRLEGATIYYALQDSEWQEIKDYTKQQIFDEQKKVFDELSKIDDNGSKE